MFVLVFIIYFFGCEGSEKDCVKCLLIVLFGEIDMLYCLKWLLVLLVNIWVILFDINRYMLYILLSVVFMWLSWVIWLCLFILNIDKLLFDWFDVIVILISGVLFCCVLVFVIDILYFILMLFILLIGRFCISLLVKL